MKHQQNASALECVRAALKGSTPESRAELLEEAVRALYKHTKFVDAGGEGLDGRDGPERHSLGGVLTEAIRHQDATTNWARS